MNVTVFDKINRLAGDGTATTVKKGSRLSAAACFSIYAFQELKQEFKVEV